MELSTQERAELTAAGVNIPSGQIARTARWVTLMGGTERGIDYVARRAVEARLTHVPADASYRSAIAAHWARRAVQSARVTIAEWEQDADDMTAAMAPVMLPGQIVRWAIEAQRTATRPTSAQIIHASTRPMGLARWSLSLEHKGSELLHAAGLPASRPDVWNAAKRTHVARPDAVAFRGTARYVNPSPVRYGRSGHQPAVEYREDGTAEFLTSARRERTTRTAVVVPVYVPRLARTGRVVANPYHAPGAPRFVDETTLTMSLHHRVTTWTTAPVRDDGTREGWRGHRRITWAAAARVNGAPQRAARAARRAARVGATATRGPVVGPWSMAARSLPAAITRLGLTDVVATIESIVRTSAAGARVTFGPVVVDVIDGSHVGANDRSYPVREWARRAAIAGIDPTAD